MKTYYRGTVSLVQDIKDLNYERVIASAGCYSYSTPVFKEYEKDYNYGEEKYLTNFFDTISRSDFKYDITDEGAIEIFNHIFSKENSRYLVPANITPKLEIVYEIITDKTGTMYAKELYTGCLFPLTFTGSNTYKIKKHITYPDGERIKIYTLYVERKLNFPNFLTVSSIIANHQVCDKNELDEYLTLFEKGLFKERRKKNFLEKIKHFANMNVLKPETLKQLTEELPKKQEKVSRQKQSSETLTMENIEYLLSQMKDKSPEIYQTLSKKYETLLNQPDLVLANLAYLLGEIESYYYFGNLKANDILGYLTTLKKEYLTNFLTNNLSQTDLTLEKLNKMNEIFLKVKKNYTLLSQREVLKNFAFLYIMEIYENKENIVVEELENSYFADNLKSIVVCIKALQESGLITCHFTASLDEELTCDMVLEIIKSIKFNSFPKEEIEEFVKRI